MRVLFCGGRTYDDADSIVKVVALLDRSRVTVLHGGASGLDTLVDVNARMLGYDVEVFPAEWSKHGRAAGPIRNQYMLDSNVDIVFAFPGGAGTADMVGRAVDAGVMVVKVVSECREAAQDDGEFLPGLAALMARPSPFDDSERREGER